MCGICLDITDRRRADAEREQMRAQEQALAAGDYACSLIEASLDPLVTISPEGKITDVNEATIKITGRGRDELVGTDFSDYFTDPESNVSDGATARYSQVPYHRLPAHNQGA